MSNTIGMFIIAGVWIFFGLLFVFAKNINKYELKLDYEKLCEELGINNYYSKNMKNMCLSILTNKDNKNTFKDKIMSNYSYLIMTELKLEEGSGYIRKYNEQHKQEIRILYKLLEDRSYEYNKFLYDKAIGLINVLKIPFNQLKDIDKLDIPNKQKNKEVLEITTEIYKLYDSFFEIVNILNEDYESKINKSKQSTLEEKNNKKAEEKIEYAIDDGYILSDLNNYKKLLNNVKDDMEKRRGIF